MPIDCGTHQRLNSSAPVHASNTRRAGASKVRVVASPRPDTRSTVVGFVTGVARFALPAPNGLLILLQFIDDLLQFVEARFPDLAVPLDPCRLFLQSAQTESASPHAPDLLGGNEARLLQDADMLLHARESHVELLGKVGDRCVGTPELL